MFLRSRLGFIVAGVFIVLSVTIVIAGSTKADPVANGRKAAARICKSLPVEIYFESTIKQTFSVYPEPDRSKLIKEAMANLDKEKMRDVLISAYASNYSAQTLEAMADFMETPAGVEYATNYRKFALSIMPAFSQEAMRVYQETISGH